MKKLVAILTSGLLMFGLLAGCSSSSSSSSAASTTVDYTQVIETNRPSGNEAIEIIDETTEDQTGMLTFLGVSPEEMQKYAISVSLMNTRAYAIAIILPQEGKEQSITDALDQFVVNQKAVFENYLPDQYEIANSAEIKTTSTGEVVLVMCVDSASVMSKIEKQLKG